MFNIKSKLKKKVMKNEDQRYFVVYRNAEDEVKTYEIGRPQLAESFGNKDEERNNIGFKAFCFGRQEVRSFRHDRIVSLTRAS
jgi:hypothetical protein|tara:strand:- start:8545 stop:8793 length:249 start_codon:yes stop_codon:yes gene_type:complete